ncbi:hypothetical protein GGI12_002829, partial [Dipsacomyces acuminosporus]
MSQKRKASQQAASTLSTTNFSKRHRRTSSENTGSGVYDYGAAKKQGAPACQLEPRRKKVMRKQKSEAIVLSDSSEESDSNSVVEVEPCFSASLPLPPKPSEHVIVDDSAVEDSADGAGIVDVYEIDVNRQIVTLDTIANSGQTDKPSEAQQPSERMSYLHIFDKILSTVLEAESFLFSEQEQAALSVFKSLDRHARYIFTRLFMRKQAWIRVSSLSYGEQAEIIQSCKILCGHTGTGMEPFLLTESDIDSCDEAVLLLTVAELRVLAKSRGIAKVSNKNKDEICSMVLKAAKQKTVLSFFQPNKAESSKQRTGQLIQSVIKLTGPIVKLNPPIVELFERLHLVFFRSPKLSLDENTMKVAVLATIGQIRFPNYEVVRSPDLFASREDVVAYKALREVGSQMAELAMSPVKVVEDHRRGWEIYLDYKEAWLQHVESLRKATDTAGAGLASKGEIDNVDSSIAYWKRHFTPGWALARIVERGAKFAAALKQFEDEEEILLSLLDQHTYRLGKRGEWYERLILLRTAHLKPKKVKGDEAAAAQIEKSLRKARDICIRALNDKYVGRISLHVISRQLKAIEAKLNVEDDQAYCHEAMCRERKDAPERTVYGVRIRNPSYRGPSMWDGDDGVPCSVEELAMWRYRDQGYEGLHSENSIATTLFGLLFWDTIFHPLPGVLDTEYQSQPLDMGSESFYYSRQTLVDEKLQKIKDGKYADSIKQVYEAEYGAVCTGVSWDYTLDQLLAIAE